MSQVLAGYTSSDTDDEEGIGENGIRGGDEDDEVVLVESVMLGFGAVEKVGAVL